MARIRTIKPEFWTDENIVECSLVARLLFIGMWNFADDNGNIERSAKQMKMKIFPADDVDVEALVSELIRNGLVSEYTACGSRYLNIRGFKKHQNINRPSKNKLPHAQEPPRHSLNTHGGLTEDSLNTHGGLTEDSLNTHGGLTEDSLTEGKGREGKGKEVKTPPPLPPSRMTLAQARKRYRDHMGAELGGGVNQTLTVICQTHTAEAIELALEATSTRLPRPTNPFSYFQAVLSGQSLERASPDEFDPSKDYPAGSFFAAMKADYEAKHGN